MATPMSHRGLSRGSDPLSGTRRRDRHRRSGWKGETHHAGRALATGRVNRHRAPEGRRPRARECARRTRELYAGKAMVGFEMVHLDLSGNETGQEQVR